MTNNIPSNEYWFIVKDDKIIAFTDNKRYMHLYCMCRKRALPDEECNKYIVRHRYFDDIPTRLIESMMDSNQSLTDDSLYYKEMVGIDDTPDDDDDKIILSSYDYMIMSDYGDSAVMSIQDNIDKILDSQLYLNPDNNFPELFARFKKTMDEYQDIDSCCPEDYDILINYKELFKYLLKYKLID